MPTDDTGTPEPESKGGRAGRWSRARATWLVGACAGALVAAVVGTIYVTRVRSDVETLVSGESRLHVQLLGPGEFVPMGMTFSGAVVLPDGDVAADDIPADARTLADYDAYLTWALDHGGTAADTLPLQVTVRARTDTPVVLNGLDVEVLARDDPVDGWYRFPDLGCGVVPVRQILIDLDEQNPTPLLAPEDGSTPRPMTDVHTVTATDPEVFQVRARTTSSDVRFRLSVRYQSEAGSGSQPIGDFRVTAIDDQQAYELVDSTDPDRGFEPVDRTGPIGC